MNAETSIVLFGITYFQKTKIFQPVASHFNLAAFPYFQRSSIKKIANDLAAGILNNKQLLNRTVVKADSIHANCVICYISPLEYLCTFTTINYPQRVAFSCLSEVGKSFDKKHLEQLVNKYYSADSDLITQINKKIDAIKPKLTEELNKLVSLETDIQEMQIQAEEMKNLAASFEKASKRKKCCVIF